MTCDHPTQEQVPRLLSLWKRVFGEYGDFWENFLDTAFSPERCLCLMENGEILAALTWMDGALENQKLAYVYAVMTHPAHRGRGLCRRLMEAAHRHLQRTGYTAALLVPADEGLRQMYRTMGYRNGTGFSEFTREAGETSVFLRPLTAAEFSLQRRNFLPEGGVRQEGSSLAFLARQEQFFLGEDFLLTAHVKGNVLHATELLGNVTAAPGILRTLGCQTGIFRTPGEERPFAMYHPLCPDARMPRYLGFDFD